MSSPIVMPRRFSDEEAARSTGRIEDDIRKLNLHEANARRDDRLRRKILSLALFESLASQHLKRQRYRRYAKIDELEAGQLLDALRYRLVGKAELLILIADEHLWIYVDERFEAFPNGSGCSRSRLHGAEKYRACRLGLALLVAFELQQQKIAKLIELIFPPDDVGVADHDLIEQVLHRLSQNSFGRCDEVVECEALNLGLDRLAWPWQIAQLLPLEQNSPVGLAVKESAGRAAFMAIRPHSELGMRFGDKVGFELSDSRLLRGLLAFNYEKKVAWIADLGDAIKDGDVNRKARE